MPWSVTLSGHFGRVAHINLQEARALKLEIRRVICDSPQLARTPRRCVCGVDSRVLCGAVSKRRSPSYRLNGILRCLSSLLVSFRLSLALPWVGAKFNAADFPSRFVPLPPPCPLTSGVACILGLPPSSASPGASVQALGAQLHPDVSMIRMPRFGPPPQPLASELPILSDSDLRTMRPVAKPSVPQPIAVSLERRAIPFHRSPVLHASGCCFPSIQELYRRVNLALNDCGRRM